MTALPSKSTERRRWTLYGGGWTGTGPDALRYGHHYEPGLVDGDEVEVMAVAEHEAAMEEAIDRIESVELELIRLREAAKVAVDDLYKAANQFAGLKPGGNNARIFIEKAARLEAALAPANREET